MASPPFGETRSALELRQSSRAPAAVPVWKPAPLRRIIASMQDLIRRAFAASISAKEKFVVEHGETLERVATLIADALGQGHKLLIFGNGGSAADAQHIACEFVNRFMVERRPLPAIALTTDTSALTAIANDYGFDAIFAKQIEALGCAGDVAIAISTSGSSPNVLRGIEACGRVGLFVVGMTGGDGGKMLDQVDFLLNVSATRETPRIQETHIVAAHVLCDLVDRRLFPESYARGGGA
jgi:D-sedoheptulose 7-phosphate isomerase